MSLKELLGEELYNQVIEKAGDSKIAIVSDGNWFPKDKFDAKNQEVKDLQGQLKDRDEQLNALKDVKPDELKQEIADLQEENQNAKTEYEASLKELQLTSAIKLAVKGKVHDEDVATTLIDKEKLVISNDGEIVGLDKQIESLQETKAYLFKTEEPPSNDPQIVPPGNPNGGGSQTWTKDSIMNVSDNGKRQQLIMQNSHLFQ